MTRKLKRNPADCKSAGTRREVGTRTIVCYRSPLCYRRFVICGTMTNKLKRIRQITNLPEHEGKSESEHEPLYVTAAPYVTADLQSAVQ